MDSGLCCVLMFHNTTRILKAQHTVHTYTSKARDTAGDRWIVESHQVILPSPSVARTTT